MPAELTFTAAPGLRSRYAGALRRARERPQALPDTRAVRGGVRVDRSHLVRYARLCGFPLRDELPVPYPHLLAFPLQLALMGQPDFPLPLVGAVHVANTVTVLRPVPVGAALDLHVCARDLRPHRRGTQVDLVSQLSLGGETAWLGTSTYLTRGPQHPDTGAAQRPDLALVEEVASGPVWQVPAGAGRAYAAVSGDWNPIHVHPLTARLLGFPTAIAHGMYSYAKVVAALGPRLPRAGLTSRVSFTRPVRLPSTVRLRTGSEPGRTVSVLESRSGQDVHAVVEHTW